jgi:hypothetical protein
MLIDRYGNAMDASRLSSISPQSQLVEYESKTPPVASHSGSERDSLRDPVAGEIADFLDGRTHAEGLLHALYDHILAEPIPERMRRLLKRRRPRAGAVRCFQG